MNIEQSSIREWILRLNRTIFGLATGFVLLGAFVGYIMLAIDVFWFIFLGTNSNWYYGRLIPVLETTKTSLLMTVTAVILYGFYSLFDQAYDTE